MHHVRIALCGRPSPIASPTIGILVQEKRRNTTLSTAVDSKREKLHTGGGRRLRQRITLTTNDTNDEVTQWRLLQSDRRRPPTRRRPGTGKALPARRPRPATAGVLPPLPARGRALPGTGRVFPATGGRWRRTRRSSLPWTGSSRLSSSPSVAQPCPELGAEEAWSGPASARPVLAAAR